MFELPHLQYVLAATEQRSFRRAARCLSVEPSTISRRIRDLEDTFSMLSRTQNTFDGVRLVEAGHTGHQLVEFAGGDFTKVFQPDGLAEGRDALTGAAKLLDQDLVLVL